jgi:hypothetical protein
MVEGELEELSSAKCLIGYRANRRLGLEMGKPFSIRSTRNTVLYELNPVAVFRTDTPLDDEILVDLDTARLIQGLSINQVTLIRAKIREEIINKDRLLSVLSNPFELEIITESNNDSSWESNLMITTQKGIKIWEGKITIPGEKHLSLSLGDYHLKLEDQQRLVTLDSDQTHTFTFEREEHRVILSIKDQSDRPNPGAQVNIEQMNGTYSQSVTTDNNGESIINLASGTYQFEATSENFTKTTIIEITKDKYIMIKLGPVPLHVLVFDEENKPVTGASVKVFNGSTIEQFTDIVGETSFTLKEGIYNIVVTASEKTRQKDIHLNSQFSIFFNLGENPIHDLILATFWSNGTIAPHSKLKVSNEAFTWKGVTNSQGITSILGLPDNTYTFETKKAGYSNIQNITTGTQNTITLIIPSPVEFNEQEVTPELLQYLPQSVTVNLQDKVFTDSMRMLVNLVTSSIIILAILFTASTTLNSVDIIRNAVKETSHTVGVFRSLGVSKNNLTLTFSTGIVLLSIVIGRIGYIIGLNIVSYVSEKGLIILAGYTLYPVDNTVLMLASSLICPIVASVALFQSLNGLLDQSTLDLLKGLRKQDILFLPTETRYLIAAFLVPFLFRSIPEIIVWSLPTGYDTISSYIPTLVAMRTGFEAQVFDIVKQRPVFWIFASLTYPFEGITPFKFYPVLLHGLLGAAVYLYTHQITREQTKSLAISILTTLYFVSLRVSWDLYALEMGLVLVFLTLTLLSKGINNLTETILGFTLILGSVLTHEVASLFLFAASAPIGYKTYKERGLKAFTIWLFVVALPLIFFIYRIIVLDLPLTTASLNSPSYPSSTYWRLVRSILTLYGYVVLPLLPLSLLGLKKKPRPASLLVMYLGVSLAALSPIFSPNKSISLWDRWTYLTVYPLAFFAVQGINSLSIRTINLRKPHRFDLKKIGIVYLALVIMSSLSFIATESVFQPYQWIYGPEANWVVRFIPSTMLSSTIQPSTAREVIDAINWLNTNLTKTAVLLVDEEFRGYAAFYCNREKILVQDLGLPSNSQTNYVKRVDSQAEEYALKGFDVYLLARHFEFSKLHTIKTGIWINLFKFSLSI